MISQLSKSARTMLMYFCCACDNSYYCASHSWSKPAYREKNVSHQCLNPVPIHFYVTGKVQVSYRFGSNSLVILLFLRKRAALSTGLSYVIVFAIESSVSVRLYPVRYLHDRGRVEIFRGELWTVSQGFAWNGLVDSFQLERVQISRQGSSGLRRSSEGNSLAG